MTKREYIAILLGTLCFVLMTAGLSYTALHLYTTLFVSLLGALEVGWHFYAPKAWRTAHTVTFPAKVTISKAWIGSALLNIVHHVLYGSALLLCVAIIFTGGTVWFSYIAPFIPDDPTTAWVYSIASLIVGVTIMLYCFSLTEDSAPPANVWVGEVILNLGKAVGVALLGSIVFPVLVTAALLIVCIALAWMALALLIGIALLASEKQFLVVTIGIITGSAASLIFGVTPVAPWELTLRLLVGAAAGFGSGEAVHYAGKFFSESKVGRVITNRVLLQKKHT